MKKTLIIWSLVTLPLVAQQPVAPTNEPVGPRRGEDFDGYNLTQS
jgi:hypothetical protein